MAARGTGGAREPITASLHELDTLRAHASRLEQALDSRADIDRAIGMVMLVRQVDADTAWRVLVRVSQDTNTKVRTLAAAMRDVAAGSAPATDAARRALRLPTRRRTP
ncbi:ANTAR domain-containing protein [Nocardiopsis trehalosi]|uniref:ANTAR domain-containing protein n=1 Tax=Nocardiopsis trehalosi TaxID=109329 RepID=UPI00083340F5|nr:ANTAR domain-containing protein [Nocardiopsis trehalosi]